MNCTVKCLFLSIGRKRSLAPLAPPQHLQTSNVQWAGSQPPFFLLPAPSLLPPQRLAVAMASAATILHLLQLNPARFPLAPLTQRRGAEQSCLDRKVLKKWPNRWTTQNRRAFVLAAWRAISKLGHSTRCDPHLAARWQSSNYKFKSAFGTLTMKLPLFKQGVFFQVARVS